MKPRPRTTSTPARRFLLTLGVGSLLSGLVWAQAGTTTGATPSASAATMPSSGKPSRKPTASSLTVEETQQTNALFTKWRPATLRLEDCPRTGPCSEPSGIGSGFLISADGLALTAYHVVFQSTRLEAVTSDQKRYPVSVVGFDDQHDVALLKVGVPAGTPFLPLATTAPARNDLTLVIGNGNGEFLRSRTGRLLSRDAQAGRADFPAGTLELSVQLVPGDSGGPVINARGEAVGVVSYISLNPANRRITSYAVPVTRDDTLLASLRNGVKNEAPLIGVSMLPELANLSEKEFAEANRTLKLGLGNTPGAFFMGVTPGSPAAQAGLLPLRIDAKKNITPGDVVTAVDGKRIVNFNEFQSAVRQHRPGQTVTLTILRGGKEIRLNLTLAPRSSLNPNN